MATEKITQTLSTFDQLPDSAGIAIAVVSLLISRSNATIWRYIRNGSLKRIPTASGSALIEVGSVRRYLAGAAA